jgi:hypothetical protein
MSAAARSTSCCRWHLLIILTSVKSEHTRSPRLWVDVMQRQTGKIRWTPISPANVTLVRYDYFIIRSDHLAIGMKGLLDALKVRTTGRRDHIHLYYFGAIVDDGPRFIDVSWDQKLVGHPKDAGVRIRVLPKAAQETNRT